MAFLLSGLMATLALSPSAMAQPALFDAVRAADLQLARIGFRLATANAPLCDRLEPGTGLLLHTPELYASGIRAEARTHFKLTTRAGVEAVVPGSPAAQAGVRADDAVVTIAGEAPPAADPSDDTAAINRLYDRLAALPATQAITLRYRRDGVEAVTTIQPVPACRTRFELRIANDFTSLADGRLVQVPAKLAEEYGENGLVAIVAHELAHNIMRHRERLNALGVDFGMMSAFGRNVRYFRQAETEADILAVYLLANAGYDPQIAVDFWNRFGPAEAGGVLRARTHPAWRDRVATMAHHIALIRANPNRPIIPPLIATRAKPMDGDWQAILIRAAD